MKILPPLFLLCLISNCSHKKPTVGPDYYLQLNKIHAAKHKVCKEQNKEVFGKAISENLEAELDDENYFFVRSEEKAISWMKKVDLNKLTLKENQQEYEALIRGCGMKKDKSHVVCDTIEPPYKYYRGLLYALRQYQWSASTEDLAVRHILQYVKHVGESKSTLIHLATVNDLLLRLEDLGHVPESLREGALDFRHELEATQEALHEKITKVSKKKFECEDAIKLFQDEKITVIGLSDRFLVMLRNAK